MKTIGLIGGMSWESSLTYYRLINQFTKAELGGLHSAKCLMVSVDFAEIETLQHAGDWESLGKKMAEAAMQLELGGADFILICTNTMHKLVPDIQDAVDLPILHIADATAATVKAAGINTIGLLGTRFTMEEDFYKGRLTDKFDLNVVIPETVQRETVHTVIYDELCLGDIRDDSREAYKTIINDLKTSSAEGVILGCTEIGLLVKQKDSVLPVFDTTEVHAQTAVKLALGLMDDTILS